MEEKKTKNFSKYPTLNREYKDSLFRLIFSEKKDLLDLYNALNGTSYSDPEELEVNTLEDAVYISIKNDISFLVGGTLNLYEHQSTYNPNLPIRGLIYLAHLYEGYIVMLNINYGHNQELMEKCRRLREYSQFVFIVREQKKMYEDPEEATLRAVDICIEQGVLVDILRKHKAEVISMVLSSFNQEAYEEDMYETGYKEGERRINTLYEKLLKEQRMDDMKRAVEDEAYRETLLREYDL